MHNCKFMKILCPPVICWRNLLIVIIVTWGPFIDAYHHLILWLNDVWYFLCLLQSGILKPLITYICSHVKDGALLLVLFYFKNSSPAKWLTHPENELNSRSQGGKWNNFTNSQHVASYFAIYLTCVRISRVQVL